MKKTIGLVLYDGCIFFEVALALELIAKNFEIVTLTPDGQNITLSNGTTITVARKFSALDPADCAALLIPGGDPRVLIDNQDVATLIQKFDQQKKIIAAICAGPAVVASAGVLKGRRIAHGYERAQLDSLREIFTGVELTDDPVVRDGHFLTAKPWAHINFAVEFAKSVGVIADDKVAALKNYYKGRPYDHE